MKYITLPHAGVLTGLSIMLDSQGANVDDIDIAQRMEAPYLFIHDGDRYRTGAGLYHPQWINLYLNSIGMNLTEHYVPCEDTFAYLRSISTAMVFLHVSKKTSHFAVYSGYSNGRYSFINIKRENSSEPDSLSLTKAMLRNRLDESVRIYTLQECAPATTDYMPLLFQSLKTLAAYQRELLSTRKLIVTKEQLDNLHRPIFQALMQDALPMMLLIGDTTLAEELRHLQHDYKHIFTRNGPATVPLYERLPQTSITNCITWLRENIVDRLYELGATDEDIIAGHKIARVSNTSYLEN